MNKLKFFNLPEKEKVNIFRQISTKTGLPAFAIEKDWWVVQTLAAVYQLEIAPYLIFKGGTSLSKAWKIIERFSEDIDLAMDRTFFGFDGDLTKNQRDKLKKISGKYVDEKFYPELKVRLAEFGFSAFRLELEETHESDRDRIINLYYPYVIDPPGYLQPRVQLELSGRSLREPFTVQTFNALTDEVYPDSEFVSPPVNIPTVNPERTFLEKIFLLHEEFQRPPGKRRVERLSRHIYDVVKLSKTEFAEKALNDPLLYETIVKHRQTFTRVGGVNYNLHQQPTINPLPLPEVMNAWEADYKAMAELMIYEKPVPTFEQLKEKLNTLKKRINNISWKFNCEFPIPGQ
jgi:predicted nucleotidyltransferase component of viral defense system